jgi:hypothetical protein
MSVFKSRLFRDIIFFVFAALMLLAGFYAVLLLLEAFRGHGSSEGNSLIFVAGFTLLIFSIVSLVIGFLNRKTASCS